jgi:hypothetical protein
VELTFTTENLSKGFPLSIDTVTVSDDSLYNGKFFIPFALLPPGDTLRLTVTFSDSTVIFTGSPLDFTTPAPYWIAV